LVVGTSAIDCLERLVSEMTYYAWRGTLNPTHSLTLIEVLAEQLWHWCEANNLQQVATAMYLAN